MLEHINEGSPNPRYTIVGHPISSVPYIRLADIIYIARSGSCSADVI